MKRTVLTVTLIGVSAVCAAQTYPVTDDAVFTFNGQEITISRSANLDPSTLDIVSRAYSDCMAPCLSPMVVDPAVVTYGELDVIAFMSGPVEAGSGLLVDARLPDARAGGSIPAAINIPAATLAPSNPYRSEILLALGAAQTSSGYDYSGAYHLLVFDSGPATQDAANLISDLLSTGYPAEKIAYYRGGMQVWSTLGLTMTGGGQ